jgi:transposase
MFSSFLVHCCMDKEDARNQTLEQLHERRKQVVRLHRKGHGVMRIAELTGLSYPTVRKAIDLYEAGEVAATIKARWVEVRRLLPSGKEQLVDIYREGRSEIAACS